MTFFEIVKAVLDEEYNLIPATTPDERDAKIKAAMNNFNAVYRNILVTQGPNFRDAAHRFAYKHRYTAAHADMVYNLLCGAEVLQTAIVGGGDRPVNVMCLGGGPGSEILGIMRWIDDSRIKPKRIKFLIADREQAWWNSWHNVEDKMDATYPFSSSFVPIDVAVLGSLTENSRLCDADIFVFSWFLSEIFSIRQKAEPFFAELFQRAKPGALIAFVDFNDPNVWSWLFNLAQKNGFEVLRHDRDIRTQISSREQKDVLGDYVGRFGSPKLTGTFSAQS